MSILIRYGVSNQTTREVRDYPNVRTILESLSLQQGLGFGSNVEATVNGISGIDALSDGDTVDIRSRANTKG